MAVSPMLRFVVYGVAGSALESAFTSAVLSAGRGRLEVRGPSTWLMVPLYGLTLPLFEPVHDAIRRRPAWVRGAVYASGIIGVEAVSGLIWRRVTGRVPWEYRSGVALGGVTRLDYAPAWGLVGLAAERLHDAMTDHRVRAFAEGPDRSSEPAGVLG